jgi:hypothetical protein
MAQATTKTTAKTIITLTMGPKEAQSLRNLLARVSKDSDLSSDILNLKSIRKALANQGFHRDNANSDLTGVVYG